MGDTAGKEVCLALEGDVTREAEETIHRRVHGEEASLSALCRRFGISRKTGYKWIERFLSGCELADRSRRPRHSPRAVATAIEDAIVAARRERPTWGPEKLRTTLLQAHPGAALPSVSTFALIFQRNGLVIPRRRRRRVPRSSTPLAHATAPNARWCIDFKGDFHVGRRRCYPLTVPDAYRRYLLACVALRNTRVSGCAARQIFRIFGLPTAMRSDNGPPFASVHGPGGLSELSAWWPRTKTTLLFTRGHPHRAPPYPSTTCCPCP